MNNSCTTITGHNKPFIQKLKPMTQRKKLGETSVYAIIRSPLNWREIFAYAIYRHAMEMLME